MKENSQFDLFLCLLFLVLTLLSAEPVSAQRPANPVLVYTGPEYYEVKGKQFTRYRFSVFNLDVYPTDFFAAAPDLPPCGSNANASRTWVDFYTQSGQRLYGFCALRTPQDLNSIWFALESESLPPSWVYVEFVDRKTNTRYKSNLAETTQ